MVLILYFLHACFCSHDDIGGKCCELLSTAAAAGDDDVHCVAFLLLALWGASSPPGTVIPCQQRPTPLAGL